MGSTQQAGINRVSIQAQKAPDGKRFAWVRCSGEVPCTAAGTRRQANNNISLDVMRWVPPTDPGQPGGTFAFYCSSVGVGNPYISAYLRRFEPGHPLTCLQSCLVLLRGHCAKMYLQICGVKVGTTGLPSTRSTVFCPCLGREESCHTRTLAAGCT